MEIVAFDTHAFVKRLTEAGMPGPQAEVLVAEQVSLIESNLATKRDAAEINQNVKVLEAKTDQNVAEINQNIKALEAKTDQNVAEINQNIKALEAKTDQNVAEINQNIKVLEAQIAQTNENVKALEAKIAQTNENVKALEAQIVQINQKTEEISRGMKEMETSLKRDIKDAEYRMTIRFGGMAFAIAVAAGSAVVALIKLLP